MFANSQSVILGLSLMVCAVFPAFSNAQEKTTPDPQSKEEWSELLVNNGIPQDWQVAEWSDIAKPVENAPWKISDGVLSPSDQRGTWLISKNEYENFELELEIRLTELGNSGIALRAPRAGDPAFDGLEFQIADFRYNPEAKDSELSGGIYRAIAPSKQVYKPTEWNTVHITLQGKSLKAVLNGEQILDVDLDKFTEPVQRHDGTDAPSISKRPTQGHIGFQHLSRDGKVEIRKVRIRKLPRSS